MSQQQLALALNFCNAFQNTPPDSLICIDECAFYVGEQGKVGWAPKGRRLIVKASRTLRRTKYTLVMAISASGIVHHEIRWDAAAEGGRIG